MGLSDVAAGLVVTTRQRERGVAITDDTDEELTARLEPFAAELPCGPDAVATIMDARVERGETIAASAREAGVEPITARKALHRVGEPVAPLDTAEREALADWLDAERSWAGAVGAAEDRAAFALAAYAATHDPIPGASETVADWLADI